MKACVFDTGALVQYFADNDQMRELFQRIGKSTLQGMVPMPILSELYYKTCQKLGNEVARVRYVALRNSNLSFVGLEDNSVMEAGRIKCQYSFTSLADSFAAGLALLEKCPLVTTDGRLAEVKGLKIIKISF